MQSLHYNSGSIKLTRERSTMVSRWEANEVARWIGGIFEKKNSKNKYLNLFYFIFLFVKDLLVFKLI